MSPVVFSRSKRFQPHSPEGCGGAPTETPVRPYIHCDRIITEQRPDTLKSIAEFMDRLGPAYVAELDKLCQGAPPLSPDCKITVFSPAASHEEEDHIFHCLTALSKQNLDPEQFEILILANHPDITKTGSTIKPDNTLFEIERFQKKRPEINVTCLRSVFERESITMGYIRAVLGDAASRRVQLRDAQGEHFFHRNDVDLQGADPRMLATFLRLFERNPNIDAFAGPIYESPLDAIRHPLAFLSARFGHLVEKRCKSVIGIRTKNGPNLVVRASMYAQANGYNHRIGDQEDAAFDKTLFNLRKGTDVQAIAYSGTATRLYTSTRRGIAAVESGVAYHEQWSHENTSFGVENGKIRKNKGGQNRFDQQLQDPEFHKRVQSLFNRTIDMYREQGTLARLLPSIKTILELHFKFQSSDYEMAEDGKLTIFNADRLKAALKELRHRAFCLWQAKTGLNGSD